MRSKVDTLRSPTLLIDPQGGVVEMNISARRLIGLGDEDTYEGTWGELFQYSYLNRVFVDADPPKVLYIRFQKVEYTVNVQAEGENWLCTLTEKKSKISLYEYFKSLIFLFV